MRRAVLLVVIIFLTLVSMLACSTRKENMYTDTPGVYFDKDWDNNIGTYQGAAIPNEECAIAVATAIFNNMEKGQSFREYVPIDAFFDTEDEIWIVFFSEENSRYTLGGGCSIALQKQDGKVLRIWFGE